MPWGWQSMEVSLDGRPISTTRSTKGGKTRDGERERENRKRRKTGFPKKLKTKEKEKERKRQRRKRETEAEIRGRVEEWRIMAAAGGGPDNRRYWVKLYLNYTLWIIDIVLLVVILYPNQSQQSSLHRV